MPKLKALLACEKVIFDQEGPVSIIGIFQRMNIQLTAVPLPEKAVSPSMWSIFVLWESDPREVGQEFTQIATVTAPDGVVFAEHHGVFKNTSTDDTQVKTKILMPGLPIWKEGWITVHVQLKDCDASGEYRFQIQYLPPVEVESAEAGA